MFGFDPEREAENHVIKLTVAPERSGELDTILPPVLDFPVAAIRSPEIRVEANNLIRISVLVKRAYKSAPGVGGVIVRDTIGGEQFQFRSNAEIARFSRVVLFRKAPANGTFTVTLGLAGYGDAYFDEFRVEVIEEGTRSSRTWTCPGPSSGEHRGFTGAPKSQPSRRRIAPERCATPATISANSTHPKVPACGSFLFDWHAHCDIARAISGKC